LQAGAEICSGYRLIGMTPSADGARLVLQDLKRDSTEEVVATTVVGADGSFSTVAKFAERRVRETVPIVQALVPLPPGASPQQTQVWFDPAVTPYFLWSFPESAQRAAVGLIARDGRTARGALERFLRTLGLTPIAWQAARVPLFRRAPRPWTRLGGCDVFLVGDAAGHVKVSTVGGLVTGLRGARAVAEAILTQAPYQACLRALDRELTLHRWVRLVLNRFRPKDYDDLLDLLEGPPAALLGAYTRDELAATFVRLLRAQPRLAKFARRLVFA
jgi:flavin-dependent dehydrogenase